MKNAVPIMDVKNRLDRFLTILDAYGAFSNLAAREFAVGFVEKLAASVDDKSWEKAVWSGHDAADLAIDRIETGLKRFRKKRKNS